MLSKFIESRDLSELSENVRNRRKQVGMTQSQLAAAAHLADNTVQRLESVSTQTSVETLFQIAQALGVTPNDLAPKHYGFHRTKNNLSAFDDSFNLLTDENKELVMKSVSALISGFIHSQGA